MKPISRVSFIAAVLAAGAAHAGTVTVNFVEPGKYYDLGFNEASRADSLEALNQSFARLAGRLPANATLKVDVLDVDLAGKIVPHGTTRGPYDVRIARSTDWPRMHLRYELVVDGVVRSSGNEWIKSQDFLSDFYRPLRAEQLMVARWFDDRFAANVLAAR
jgi:hypothetical protein